jgi:hypothetical protein
MYSGASPFNDLKTDSGILNGHYSGFVAFCAISTGILYG